jgi:hypothetical protein
VEKGMKLRIYDGVAVACFLILPPLLYMELGSLTEKYGAAAWLVLLIAAAIMLCLFLITSFLCRQHEGKNIIEITANVTGRPFAALYGLALALYFVYYIGICALESARVLKIYSFELTPLYVIAGLILLTAFVMNIFGGRTVIKSTGFFLIMLLLGIVLVMFLGINRYNPDHLFPLSLDGIGSAEGLYRASMFNGVIMLAMFAPGFKNIRAFRRAGIISVLTAVTAAGALFVCYIMMFSPAVGSILTCGFIEMGKSSYFNHFFYRFEAVLLFFIIFSAAIQASLGLLIAKESLTHAFNIKSPKTTAVICAIAAAIVIVLKLPDTPVKNYSVFLVAGMPIFLFIISSIKRVFK